MKWTRQQRFGTVPMTALVNAIAARADKLGVTWVAQQTLADDIGSTARYARKLIAKAERLGILSRRARSSGKGGRLTDVVTLAVHKSFQLTVADVRKASATGTRVPLRVQGCNRNKTHVATGTRVPGNNKGSNTYPSHGAETHQKEPLGAGPVRLAVVGGLDVEAGR